MKNGFGHSELWSGLLLLYKFMCVCKCMCKVHVFSECVANMQ